MVVTVYGTVSSDGDYVLSYNFNSTNRQDNSNWVKMSNPGSILPGGSLNELQKNGGGFFSGCGTFSSTDGDLIMGFGTVPGSVRRLTALSGGELSEFTLDTAITNMTAGRVAFFSEPDLSAVTGNAFAFFGDGVAPGSDPTSGFFIYSSGGVPVFRTAGGSLITPSSQYITANRQTASYTLVLGDASKLVEMNVAGANNLTVPPNSSVAFPVGTQILISQYGAGQTTVVAGSGVTIRSKSGNLKLSAQYVGATLIKIATNEWYLIGDLSA
jgi:hypothetical protein